MKQKIIQAVFAVFVCAGANAQVNSGSTGGDGALDFSSINYTTNIVINMADHPNGIYQYTYANIPTNVTVTFVPNANNSPVTWLLQSNAVINGQVNVSGQGGNPNGYNTGQAGTGGPGGYGGGTGGTFATGGQGPGGGVGVFGNGGSYATGPSPYGDTFLIPLLGGSGGGGTVAYSYTNGGGGAGGAILIAASGQISLNGSIIANGGSGVTWGQGIYSGSSGAGSGGAVRLVATQFSGSGNISANGGSVTYNSTNNGASGRIRVDSYVNTFSGSMSASNTLGSQFIIIPVSGQVPQLTVTGVGGVAVSASPTGVLTTPDAVLSPQQNNPIPVVVSCTNLPLNTLITVSVKPANGSPISATGYNTIGTLAASTATIPIVMPRGGGLIYATATTGN